MKLFLTKNILVFVVENGLMFFLLGLFIFYPNFYVIVKLYFI